MNSGCPTGEQKVYFYFFKRPERSNQEVLSHSFICLTLPYIEGICFDMQHGSLLCNSNIQWSQVTCSVGDIFTH